MGAASTASNTQVRIATIGSVDDGKSTLIGRLLHDSKGIFEDQLSAVTKASRRYGDGTFNLALLTDGLRAEREQGITIDVAYRYFATPKRSFVLADTPGHAQFTRNMVTGASVSDIAIVLVDARHGVVEQTRRHVSIAALLGVSHLVLAVNKMDLVDWDETIFDTVVTDVAAIVSTLGSSVPIHPIPICATDGENVVDAGDKTPWYEGPSVLELLETLDITPVATIDARLAVQWTLREHGGSDYRGYAGRVLSGSFRVNDKITVLPSGIRSEISKIETNMQEQDEVHSGTSVTLHLKDNIDIGRGDILVNSTHEPIVSQSIEADLCWMDTKPLDTSILYLLQHNSKVTKCKIRDILHKVNINTLEKIETDTFQLNDIGRIVIRTAEPLAFDLYQENKLNGGAILIDPRTNLTVGALMFRANAE